MHRFFLLFYNNFKFGSPLDVKEIIKKIYNSLGSELNHNFLPFLVYTLHMCLKQLHNTMCTIDKEISSLCFYLLYLSYMFSMTQSCSWKSAFLQRQQSYFYQVLDFTKHTIWQLNYAILFKHSKLGKDPTLRKQGTKAVLGAEHFQKVYFCYV